MEKGFKHTEGKSESKTYFDINKLLIFPILFSIALLTLH